MGSEMCIRDRPNIVHSVRADTSVIAKFVEYRLGKTTQTPRNIPFNNIPNGTIAKATDKLSPSSIIPAAAGIIVVGTVPRIPPIIPPHFSIATVTKMATRPANTAKKSVDNIRHNDLNLISIALDLLRPKTSLSRHR